MVHISHTLEDIVLTRRIPAMIFTGFQESSHWRQETQRYRALARVAQQVCIFAAKPLPHDSTVDALQVALSGDDPLRQEWFVVIVSTTFSVVLCGQDRLEASTSEATRQFDTFWTFEPQIVAHVLDLLEIVIDHYRPDRLGQFQAARQNYPPHPPDAEIVTAFTTELIRFEERLNQELLRAEAQARAGAERFRQVVQSINDHIYVYAFLADGSPQQIYVSPNWISLTGYPLEKATVDWDFWPSLIVPEDR
ncbi:MAG: hypothetical protein GYB67_05645, partial [Chloroflexi bacterium]|nr:hypothetical protein [Chloroflexota bacterium]